MIKWITISNKLGFARQQTNKTNADNVNVYNNVGGYIHIFSRHHIVKCVWSSMHYIRGDVTVNDLSCINKLLLHYFNIFFILCIYNLYIFVKSLPKNFVKNIKIMFKL